MAAPSTESLRGTVRRSHLLGACLLTASFACLGNIGAGWLGPFAGGPSEDMAATGRRQMVAAVAGSLLGAGLQATNPLPANAARRVAYPPIDRKDKTRCEWKSSAMGQANAQRDKLFDLRECQLANTKAADIDIAGVLMNGGDFTGVDFSNTMMSKAIASKANFEKANFFNTVADRVTFDGSNLKGASFKNALLTGSTFEDADLEGADFTDSIIDQFGIRPLCANPTMKGTNPATGADTFLSAGCDIQGLAR